MGGIDTPLLGGWIAMRGKNVVHLGQFEGPQTFIKGIHRETRREIVATARALALGFTCSHKEKNLEVSGMTFCVNVQPEYQYS